MVAAGGAPAPLRPPAGRRLTLRGTPASDEIRRLDPERDHQRIVYLLGCQVFWWDDERALELALLRTYAVPEISRVLVSTGELVTRTRKRYDDTELLMSTLVEHGYDSVPGRAALRRINQMHGRHDLAHEDLRYVLSTFVLDPIRWVARYGARPLTTAEQWATFRFYMEVGRRMGIRDLPATLDELERFSRAYEADRFAYDDANRALWEATSRMFLELWLPPRVAPLARPVLEAVVADVDPRLPGMFGFAAPPRRLVAAVRTALRARGRLLAGLGERRTPVSFTTRPRPTYPHGYRIEDLGT